MKRHIEFLGLPGSGKTTLAYELCGYLNSNNHKALLAEQALYVALKRRSHYYELRYPVKYCSYERGKRWLYEVCRQPRFSYDSLNRFFNEHEKMAESFCDILKYPEKNQNCALLIKWLVRLYSGYQLAKENLKDDETMLVDEGFCNRALSIFGYGKGTIDPGKLQEYITCVPAPDVVISVEASAETREKRLSDRGYPRRLKDLSVVHRKELERTLEACVPMVVAALKDRGIPVVHIKNDGSLESLYKNAGDMLGQVINKLCAIAS